MRLTFNSRFPLTGGTRLFLATLLLLAGMQGTRAQVPVQRANATVVAEGKTFYLHRVEAGQTLYSIARAYEVTVEQIKAANGKKDDTLATDEILLVPRVEPFRPVDDAFYYHEVKAGETLYSLSRQFGIRVRHILRDNPTHDEQQPLRVGATVKIALKQADRMAVERALQREVAARQALLEQQQAGDTTGFAEELSIFPPNEEESTAHVKVSVLLPFGLKDNKLPAPGEIETDEYGNYLHDERWRLSERSGPFLEFYGGLLIAVDSLKHAGHAIDLQVHDTGRDSARVAAIMEEVNRFAPHLVIGPVHANEYTWAAEQLANRDVPMIYPLSARPEGLGRFPGFVQVNAPAPALVEAMARWTAQRGQHARVIAIIPPPTVPRGEEADLTDRVRRYLAEGDTVMTVFHWDGDALPPLKELMHAGKENIVLFPTLDEAMASKLLPGLSALAGRYRVTVAGFPEWLKFTAVDEEVFFKLNLILFQPFHVNGESTGAAAFAGKYRTFFRADPSTMAYKGFDIALYFIHHAATYRERALESLPGHDATGDFSRFRLVREPGIHGLENRGFFLVNYTPAFEIKVIPFE
jgi:LysM repeat protein/ABC-type branched-subunit amino acid transport system substrate-binding protein